MTGSDVTAITAVIGALTSLVGAVTTMLIVLLRRTKKTQNAVNGNMNRLLDILQQADITLSNGAKIKYVPPNKKTQDETDMLDYLESLRGEINGG